MRRTRKRIGVALGAGGMRGMAHIGVLQVLEESGIPIDLISGASVGAFFGAAYAAGMDLYALGAYAVRIAKRDVLDLPNPFRTGLLSGKKFLRLSQIVTDNKTFGETIVPFWCSAVDLESGETAYLHSGPLCEAVRASIAIPGLLRPVQIGKKLFIDGGTVESIPIDILRENGADAVIGIDLSISAPFETQRTNPYRIMFRSVDIMRTVMDTLLPSRADVLIRPDASFMGRILPHDAAKCISVGRAAAVRALPEIRKVLES